MRGRARAIYEADDDDFIWKIWIFDWKYDRLYANHGRSSYGAIPRNGQSVWIELRSFTKYWRSQFEWAFFRASFEENFFNSTFFLFFILLFPPGVAIAMDISVERFWTFSTGQISLSWECISVWIWYTVCGIWMFPLIHVTIVFSFIIVFIQFIFSVSIDNRSQQISFTRLEIKTIPYPHISYLQMNWINTISSSI